MAVHTVTKSCWNFHDRQIPNFSMPFTLFPKQFKAFFSFLKFKDFSRLALNSRPAQEHWRVGVQVNCEIPWEHVPYLSASAVVIHYTKRRYINYQVYGPLHFYLYNPFTYSTICWFIISAWPIGCAYSTTSHIICSRYSSLPVTSDHLPQYTNSSTSSSNASSV